MFGPGIIPGWAMIVDKYNETASNIESEDAGISLNDECAYYCLDIFQQLYGLVIRILEDAGIAIEEEEA